MSEFIFVAAENQKVRGFGIGAPVICALRVHAHCPMPAAASGPTVPPPPPPSRPNAFQPRPPPEPQKQVLPGKRVLPNVKPLTAPPKGSKETISNSANHPRNSPSTSMNSSKGRENYNLTRKFVSMARLSMDEAKPGRASTA